MDLMTEQCPMCDGNIPASGFFIYRKGHEPEGPYCSKECAKADAWGPAFKKFQIRQKRVKKP